jgi:hypothetical protein
LGLNFNPNQPNQTDKQPNNNKNKHINKQKQKKAHTNTNTQAHKDSRAISLSHKRVHGFSSSRMVCNSRPLHQSLGGSCNEQKKQAPEKQVI